MRQAHEYVRPRLQSRRPLRYVGQILELGVEIAVVQEEPFDGAVKDHNAEFLVGLKRGHDLPEFQNEFRTHQIERRIVECHPPVSRRGPGDLDLPHLRCLLGQGLLKKYNLGWSLIRLSDRDASLGSTSSRERLKIGNNGRHKLAQRGVEYTRSRILFRYVSDAGPSRPTSHSPPEEGRHHFVHQEAVSTASSRGCQEYKRLPKSTSEVASV